MLNREQKKKIIGDLADKLSKQKGLVFFNYTGLKVNEFQELRAKLRENNTECQAIKKSLIDLALEKAGYKEIKTRKMPGQVALVFSLEDEILPAKILYNFSKDNQNVEILAGLMQKDYLDQTGVVALAKLPSEEELLAKLVGSLKMPIYGLHNVLEGNLRKLLFIFKTKTA